MKIAITIYPDDLAEADRVIHLLKGSRSLELDSYMGKAQVEKVFDKPFTLTGEELKSEEMNGGPSLGNLDSHSSGVNFDRPNISPGETSISKIGSSTKEAILDWVGKGQPALPKWTEHYKLLWKRGEIKFDGKVYYV